MAHAVHRVALARVDDRNALAVRAQERARVALLSATDRVEDRAVELDAALVHRNNSRARCLRVSVVPEQELGAHRFLMLRPECHQRTRVRGSRRLVHEVHVDLAPRRSLQARRPLLQVVVRIRFEAQPDVAPRRGLDERRRRIVLALGETERRADTFQRVVHVVFEPRVVAELERRPVIRGQELEEFGEARQVLLEVGWKLEQHGTPLFAERCQGAVEKPERLRRRLGLDPGNMRDAARGLDREAERVGCRRGPSFEHRRPGHPVERVVDLDRRQPRGVPGEHVLRLDRVRIEVALPFLERIAARARQQPRSRHPDVLDPIAAR